MSNTALIIEERPTTIGRFMVGRLLPFRTKRSIGPFVFIDHMGPVQMNSREKLEVLPHPHIGLSTLTYLFEGTILHRDSIGTQQEIIPGEVNWMTAGKGVVHSERTPPHAQESNTHLHGLQIWVALPKELEDMEPAFHHTPASAIPAWEEDNVHYRLIAGEWMGHKSPVPVYSPLYFLEITTTTFSTIALGTRLYGETGIYILEGGIVRDEYTYGPKQIIVPHDGELCTFDLLAHSKIYVFGGTPFPEERFMDWNFVSSDKSKLTAAREKWNAQLFPQIDGEHEFVPYPNSKH